MVAGTFSVYSDGVTFSLSFGRPGELSDCDSEVSGAGLSGYGLDGSGGTFWVSQIARADLSSCDSGGWGRTFWL